MSIEEFNALPLEARRFIENEKKCASCGGTSDLDLIYQKYLNMKKTSFYTLRIGAVHYTDEKNGITGILYPIHQDDTDLEIKANLKIAKKIYAINSEMFSTFDEQAIDQFLKAKNEINNDSKTSKSA